MVRISDILKKGQGEPEEEKKKQKEKPPVPPPETQVKESEIKLKPILEKYQAIESSAKQALQEEKQEVRISPAIKVEGQKISEEESVKLYQEISKCIESTFKALIDNSIYNAEGIKNITNFLEKIVNQLGLENENILNLAFRENSVETNYLISHSLNTCIYSIQLGLGLGYNISELTNIGLSAIFHDIGMLKYLNLANLNRRLNAEEFNEIKNHCRVGADILKNIRDGAFPHPVISAALEHHERMDGSGYPQGIKGEEMEEYTKIVGLVDVFTAMTHPRAYRRELEPLDAMREILENKNTFEYRLMKLLIERIGLFPVGSFVQLNTKEKARVIRNNSEIPLRPVVRILWDPDNREIKDVKQFDLSTQPTIFIKSAKKTAL